MPAVEARHLSKAYPVETSPRALLAELLRPRRPRRRIEALSDVSFQIEKGGAFGIVGENGAGKSTLLKILSGTTQPSDGTYNVQGRTASLLELGAAFHPEFSGRENIYFNAALNGFGRAEIQAREKAIIDFAELEEFIDRPVKTYSSGMYVRLGFAVATGFEPDILIIDEALAVGDQHFQRKCVDRILEFRKRGNTLLFCSHNLYQVKHLCDRALWLRRGLAQACGPVNEVVEGYNDYQRRQESEPARTESDRRHESRLIKYGLTDAAGRPCDHFGLGDTMAVSILGYFSPDVQPPSFGIAIVRNDGVVCYCVSTIADQSPLKQVGENLYFGSIVFPNLQLMSGEYRLMLCTTDSAALQAYDIRQDACPFIVRHTGQEFGIARLEHVWENDNEARLKSLDEGSEPRA